jgi:hypothetical protein
LVADEVVLAVDLVAEVLVVLAEECLVAEERVGDGSQHLTINI